MIRFLTQPLQFKTAAHWQSFDKFKLEGAGALEQVGAGSIASLNTKTGQYRIISETDFQHLLGLASEVQRIKGGLNAIIASATVAQKHRDADSLEALMQVVIAVGDLPRLPSSSVVSQVELPNLDPDPDDTVLLDPVALKAAQKALEETP
jgi:hypothetical protein